MDNFQLNNELDREHKNLHERLAKPSGVEFDREYINAMVEDHEEAVDPVKDKATEEQRPESVARGRAGGCGRDVRRAVVARRTHVLRTRTE